METVTARQAKNSFGDTLIKALQEPVEITKNGKPIAVLMSVENYRVTEELKLRALKQMVEQSDLELQSGDFADGAEFMRKMIQSVG